MNLKLFQLATCQCQPPHQPFENGDQYYCGRCWLQVPPAPPIDVIADWITGDIRAGYERDFLERQYGKGRVRRYFEAHSQPHATGD